MKKDHVDEEIWVGKEARYYDEKKIFEIRGYIMNTLNGAEDERKGTDSIDYVPSYKHISTLTSEDAQGMNKSEWKRAHIYYNADLMYNYTF